MAKIDIQYQTAVNDAIRDIDKVNTAIAGSGQSSQAAKLSLTDLKSGLDLATGAFRAD